MIRPITRSRLPDWRGFGHAASPEQWISQFEMQFTAHWKQLQAHLDRQFREILEQTNSQIQGVGEDIASDTTIRPTHFIHRVSGAEAIENINPPNAQRGVESDHLTPRLVSSFTGPIVLIPTSGSSWTLATGGNIALAATSVDFKALLVIFDGESWFPSYV
jgi:hypothetical protein